MDKGRARKILEAIMAVYMEPDDGSDAAAELKLQYIRVRLTYLYPPSEEDKQKMKEIHNDSCDRFLEELKGMESQ